MQRRKHERIIIGAWNVRTLLNRATTSRHERGTALVAREFQRYWVDIAALSETPIADEGSLREERGGYTFFWKGKPQTEDRIHGVGFAIRTALLRSMPALPAEINERFMKLRVPLSKIRYLTIISAYAPTLSSSDDANLMNSLTKSSGQTHRATNRSSLETLMCGWEGTTAAGKEFWADTE